MPGSFYDRKIIILDLNFRDILQYDTDEKLSTKRLLSELSANQNLIIATDNSYALCKTMLEEFQLKSGYLISDSGAIITNIANGKIIDSGTLSPDIVKKICYKCVWDGLYFSIVTDTCKYPFNLSYWLIKRYRSDLTHLTQYKKYTISTSAEIDAIIQKEEIKRIEVYFLDKEASVRKQKMSQFIQIFQKDIDYIAGFSLLHIVPKGKTRIEAIANILEKFDMDLTIEKDGIYCAISQNHHKLSASSYFSLITHEAKDQQIYDDISNLKTIEILPCGNISWINWFYSQEPLWSGNQEEVIQKAVDRYGADSFHKNEVNDAINGKFKYISIEPNANDYYQTKNKIRMNCWPEQISQIIKYVNKSKTKK